MNMVDKEVYAKSVEEVVFVHMVDEKVVAKSVKEVVQRQAIVVERGKWKVIVLMRT